MTAHLASREITYRLPSDVFTSVSFCPSLIVAVACPLSYEPPAIAILTDLPFSAISTSTKMFSVAGKVAFTPTCSQTPFVESRALAGAAGGAVGVAGGGVAGTVVGEMTGVVDVGLGAGFTTTLGAAWTVDVFPVAPGVTLVVAFFVGACTAAGGAEGAAAVGAAVVASCWTNGSLLLKRPNESSWSVSRWTANLSVSRSATAAATGEATAAIGDAVVTSTTDDWLPCRPSILGSSKPRTPNRQTVPTARKIF